MLFIKPSLNPHVRTAIQTNSVPTNNRLFISSERRHYYRPPRPTATLYLGWQGLRHRLADRRSTCPLPGRSSHKYCMNRSKHKSYSRSATERHSKPHRRRHQNCDEQRVWKPPLYDNSRWCTMHNVYRYSHTQHAACYRLLSNSFYLWHLLFVYIRVLVQLTWWWPIYEFETSGQTVNKCKKCAVWPKVSINFIGRNKTQLYEITNTNTENGKQCHRTFIAQMIRKLRIQEVLRTLKCKPVPLGLRSSNSGNEFKKWAWMWHKTQQKPTSGVQVGMCVSNGF